MLKDKLGPEPPIDPQRKLFLQALRALAKAETPAVPDKGKCWTKQSAVLEKDKRFLKQSALTDLVELVRSAVRDELELGRFDLTFREKRRHRCSSARPVDHAA